MGFKGLRSENALNKRGKDTWFVPSVIGRNVFPGSRKVEGSSSVAFVIGRCHVESALAKLHFRLHVCC